MFCDAGAAHKETEDGFGLIETMIAMLLIAILSVAFFPVLVQGLKTSTANATRAIATQILAEELEQLRDSGSICSAVKAFVASVPPAVPNQSGSLQASRALPLLPPADVCVAPFLRTVAVHIAVTDTGSGDVLAEVDTLVVLDAG